MAYKEIGINHGYRDTFLTFVGCFFSISNCSGRMIWGNLYEKYPFKKLYSTLLIGQTLFPLTLPLIASYKYLYAIWVGGTVFFSAGNFTIFPPYSNDVFGLGVGGTVYSYLATCFTWGAFILFFANQCILPYIGYNSILLLVGMISGCNFILLYILNEHPKWVITTIGLEKEIMRKISKPLLSDLKEEIEMKDKPTLDRVKSFI